MDKINYNTLKVGMTLIVNPMYGSHSKQPYKVIVIESTSRSFKTKMHPDNDFKNSHIRTFDYFAGEWEGYHKNRFEIIK